jgi:hypothetical protein
MAELCVVFSHAMSRARTHTHTHTDLSLHALVDLRWQSLLHRSTGTPRAIPLSMCGDYGALRFLTVFTVPYGFLRFLTVPYGSLRFLTVLSVPYGAVPYVHSLFTKNNYCPG